MDSLYILQVIWYFIIGLFLAGYSILDGFDLGIGALFPMLAKSEDDKKKLFDIIWPFWDGNEVWLVTGGAALFAAFPYAYSTIFSGFYLAFMLVLFALIFRAVSIEFWYYDVKRRKFWVIAFIAGSIVPSLLYGVALGNVIIGIPLNNVMDFTGNFFTLLRPYPIVIGFLGLSAILLQGSSYAVLKLDGNLKERARSLKKNISVFFVIIFVLSIIITAIYIPSALSNRLYLVSIIAIIILWLLYWAYLSFKLNRDIIAFIISSFSFIGLWAVAGAIHFPLIVKSINDSALSITLSNASSSELTLKVMLGIALTGMPLVIFYTACVYRIFRTKADTTK